MSLRIDKPRTPRLIVFRGLNRAGRRDRVDGPELRNTPRATLCRRGPLKDATQREVIGHMPMPCEKERRATFVARAAEWLFLKGGMSLVLILCLLLLGFVGGHLTRR